MQCSFSHLAELYHFMRWKQDAILKMYKIDDMITMRMMQNDGHYNFGKGE